MAYFMTGATGFIGRHVLECLLKRNHTVYCLVRRESAGRLEEIAAKHQALKGRVVPVPGDLLRPRLGVEAAQLEDLTGKIDHFFHVAALYDVASDSESLALSNVEGTRHAMELARAIEAGCLHYVSTVAVAGHYEGTFTESMLDEAEDLGDPYASTKHDAEALLRREYERPYRIYRPSVVVGHSETGEIDKADGLYYTFRLIQRLRESVPDWLPRIGLEGGSLNVVPVDYVAKAIDHIAHAKDLDGRTFHLVDPEPHKASEVIDELCRAAGAPTFSTYVDLGAAQKPLARLLDVSEQLPGARRVSDAVLAELGIPRRILGYIGHPTEYACEETLRALDGSGIEVPAFETYAGRLWEFWELHVSSSPPRSPRLARVVEGKRVAVVNATQPIERATAERLAASGASVILLGGDAAPLEELQRKIERAGGTAFSYPGDLSSRKGRAPILAQTLVLHDGIDILICGSATCPDAPEDVLGGASLAAFEAPVRAQYLAALDLLLSVLPGMRERKSGQILVLSPVVLSGDPDPAHVASWAALDAVVASTAEDLSAEGVTLTRVHVPPFESNGSTASADAESREDTSPLGLGRISVRRAASLICEALIERPRRAGTWLGSAAELTRAAAPQAYEAAATWLARLPKARWWGSPNGAGGARKPH